MTLLFWFYVYLIVFGVGIIIYAVEHFFFQKIFHSWEDIFSVLGLIGVPIINMLFLVAIMVVLILDRIALFKKPKKINMAKKNGRSK